MNDRKGAAMSLYTISDLHLSLGSQKPMDIFEGWSDYVEKIKNNWQNKIGENDTIVIPGDVSWAMSLQEFKNDAAFLESLPGKKMIIKGNHDFWWSTVSKMNHFLMENNFASISIIHNNSAAVGSAAVCGTRGWFYDQQDSLDKKIMLREVGRLRLSLESAAASRLEPIVFLHFPPVYGNYECTEITDLLSKYPVRRCYYGHLHGRAAQRAFSGEYKGILYKLVSCDSIGFNPIKIK